MAGLADPADAMTPSGQKVKFGPNGSSASTGWHPGCAVMRCWSRPAITRRSRTSAANFQPPRRSGVRRIPAAISGRSVTMFMPSRTREGGGRGGSGNERSDSGDMLIGYARVSTDDQDLRLQRAALKEAGCKRTFEEKVSGTKRDRPELVKMIEQLRDDDAVVVTRLDRLARSTRDLLDIAEKLKEAGAGLRSLAEPWADTTTPARRMVLTVFAGIAEFERELIHQRTSSGRIAAKARGVRFGRPIGSRRTRSRSASTWWGRAGRCGKRPSCLSATMPRFTEH